MNYTILLTYDEVLLLSRICQFSASRMEAAGHITCAEPVLVLAQKVLKQARIQLESHDETSSS